MAFDGSPTPNKRRRRKRGASMFVHPHSSEAGILVNKTGDYRTMFNFNNTKNRYSWICSLREKGSLQHLCSVTILSLPPQPLVVVGPAHATYHCTSSTGQKLPSCCCHKSGANCDVEEKCGELAELKEISADNVEIQCGIWQLGSDRSDESPSLVVERIVK